MCSNHTEGVSALPYDVQQTKCRKPQVGIVSESHDRSTLRKTSDTLDADKKGG